jgi:hypothetical protein
MAVKMELWMVDLMVDKKELSKAVQMDIYMAVVMAVMKEILMVDWMVDLMELLLVVQMEFETVG